MLSLVHLATIQRANTATDAFNDVAETGWEDHLADLPCLLYSRTANEIVDRETVVALEQLKMILPRGTDVTEADRVTAVTSRGDSILSATAQIRAVVHREDHLELVLERIS